MELLDQGEQKFLRILIHTDNLFLKNAFYLFFTAYKTIYFTQELNITVNFQISKETARIIYLY